MATNEKTKSMVRAAVCKQHSKKLLIRMCNVWTVGELYLCCVLCKTPSWGPEACLPCIGAHPPRLILGSVTPADTDSIRGEQIYCATVFTINKNAMLSNKCV